MYAVPGKLFFHIPADMPFPYGSDTDRFSWQSRTSLLMPGFYGYHLQVKIRPADLPGLPVRNLDVQFAFFSDGTRFFDCCRRYRNDGAVDLPCSMGTLHNTAHTRNTFFSICCLRVIPADRLGRTLDGAHSAPDTFFSGLGNQTCPARLFVGAVTWNRWG